MEKEQSFGFNIFNQIFTKTFQKKNNIAKNHHKKIIEKPSWIIIMKTSE